MQLRNTMKILPFLLIFISGVTPVFADEGYVPFDPSQVETISGKTLLIVSYGIVIGLLSLYWAYITVQTRKTSAQISALERELDK